MPEVFISSHKSEGYTVISIKDNGLGFDVAKADKAFAMFKRLHTHVEGSGIGLYIIKRIAENSGGKVEVESVEGKGTEFRVFLKGS